METCVVTETARIKLQTTINLPFLSCLSSLKKKTEMILNLSCKATQQMQQQTCLMFCTSEPNTIAKLKAFFSWHPSLFSHGFVRETLSDAFFRPHCRQAPQSIITICWCSLCVLCHAVRVIDSRQRASAFASVPMTWLSNRPTGTLSARLVTDACPLHELRCRLNRLAKLLPLSVFRQEGTHYIGTPSWSCVTCCCPSVEVSGSPVSQSTQPYLIMVTARLLVHSSLFVWSLKNFRDEDVNLGTSSRDCAWLCLCQSVPKFLLYLLQGRESVI